MTTTYESKIKTLLAAWDDATAPLDTRVRENTLQYSSDDDFVTTERVKVRKGSKICRINGNECRPWDHADFLARVRTFSIAWWFAKPVNISSFECARHGWINSASDQLFCTCCKQYVCFQINRKLSKAGELSVLKTFEGQLVTGHTKLCPWRGNPSPKTFMMLPIATKRQVYEMFICRLDEAITRIYNTMEFRKLIEGVKIDDAVKATILQEASGSANVAAPLDIVTLTSKLCAKFSNQENKGLSPEALLNVAFLVICGWNLDEKEECQANMFYCGTCNRRWEALLTTASKKSNVEESERLAKRLKSEKCWNVDLLSQHRHLCPWIVRRQSTGVDDYGEIDPELWDFVKLPGWKQNAQALVLLEGLEDSATVASSDATKKEVSDPVQAFATIQAVLGL